MVFFLKPISLIFFCILQLVILAFGICIMLRGMKGRSFVPFFLCVFGFHALEVNACFLSPDPCVFAKRRPCNTTCLCQHFPKQTLSRFLVIIGAC